jgi:transcription elongation factor Elf1
MDKLTIPCPKPTCNGELLPRGITRTHEYYTCSVCDEYFENELPEEMEGINLFML